MCISVPESLRGIYKLWCAAPPVRMFCWAVLQHTAMQVTTHSLPLKQSKIQGESKTAKQIKETLQNYHFIAPTAPHNPTNKTEKAPSAR